MSSIDWNVERVSAFSRSYFSGSLGNWATHSTAKVKDELSRADRQRLGRDHTQRRLGKRAEMHHAEDAADQRTESHEGSYGA